MHSVPDHRANETKDVSGYGGKNNERDSCCRVERLDQ
jgi:hypothetical protein